jgi:hypothetical protein
MRDASFEVGLPGAEVGDEMRLMRDLPCHGLLLGHEGGRFLSKLAGERLPRVGVVLAEAGDVAMHLIQVLLERWIHGIQQSAAICGESTGFQVELRRRYFWWIWGSAGKSDTRCKEVDG